MAKWRGESKETEGHSRDISTARHLTGYFWKPNQEGIGLKEARRSRGSGHGSQKIGKPGGDRTWR